MLLKNVQVIFFGVNENSLNIYIEILNNYLKIEVFVITMIKLET